MYFIFYPTIVSQIAESINCTSIDGTMRLYSDLEEECYAGDHVYILMFVAIPGLILWAFGMPLFYLRRLKKQREQLVLQQRLNDDDEYLAKLQSFKMQLGFLTSGYRDRFYYWEVVLLLRKTLLVILVTFLAPVSGGV